MFLKSILAGLTLAVSMTGAALAGDACLDGAAKAGRDQTTAAKFRCATCHQFDPAKPPTVGPNLHDIYGAKIGADAKFDSRYSKSMKEAGTKVAAWDDANLEGYLRDPKGWLTKATGDANPVNKMPPVLVGKPQAEIDKAVVEILAYLKAIKGKADCF